MLRNACPSCSTSDTYRLALLSELNMRAHCAMAFWRRADIALREPAVPAAERVLLPTVCNAPHEVLLLAMVSATGGSGRMTVHGAEPIASGGR